MKPSPLVLIHLSKLYLKVVTVWVTHFMRLNLFQTGDMNRNFTLRSKPIMETFEPFIRDGFVSLTSDLSSASLL